MNKKLIVKQNGFKDCGPSCLLSIMNFYGFEASHEEVTYILKTNIDGTNAYNIINGARSFGFDGYGINYTYENIVNKEITFPIICHVLKNGMYHFIVVYDVKPDYLIVMDPASNITKLDKTEFKSIYLNTSLVIFPIKKFNEITKHKKLINFILDYVYIERKYSIKALILSLITIILSLISNYYIFICIDIILPNFTYNFLIKISIIFLMLFILKNILIFYKNKNIIELENNISLRLNNDVIRKYFNLPYQYFKTKSAGESISRINDLKTFKEIFSSIILNIPSDIILILFSMIILLTINSKLFLISFVELVLYLIIVLLFRHRFSIKGENVLISDSEYNKCLNESINGYETNKNINFINNILKKLEIKYIKYINKTKSYNNLFNKQLLFKDMISSIYMIFSTIISIIFIKNKVISLGEFVLFNTIVYYFSEPIKNILDLEPNLNYIRNIYNRINDLLLIKSKESDICIDKIKGDIKIENLSYSYNGINNLFNNVNLKIKYGSKILIYGKSGNGKSTIMKIILKYLNDYDGNIYIGNINLKDISESNILFNMTYVSQNSFINNDTLKNNVIYDRNISDDKYEQILSICNLKKLRDSKKLRNNFIIEDDGFNISGGERQKIILARSLLKESNYLILDEALSEVGVLEEKEIIKKIFNNFKDKTIIYISHKEEIINMFNLKFKLERSS